MRNGLSYQMASANANNLSKKAYEKVMSKGGTLKEAKEAARKAYETEMEWYES